MPQALFHRSAVLRQTKFANGNLVRCVPSTAAITRGWFLMLYHGCLILLCLDFSLMEAHVNPCSVI